VAIPKTEIASLTLAMTWFTEYLRLLHHCIELYYTFSPKFGKFPSVYFLKFDYILAEGHFLKKPYRSNLNEASS
jgi:hypothetical protein